MSYTLPWQRGPALMPARRAALPRGVVDLTDLARAIPVDRPGMPPHMHIQLLEYGPGGIKVPYAPVRSLPGMGLQQVVATAERAAVPCEAFGCEWYRDGHEGEAGGGKRFAHPQGVECGDFARCTDPECPCPDRVLLWPDGSRKGHLGACRYCSGSYRVATAGAPVRAVSLDEAWTKVAEGIDTLTTIRTRGL